MVPEQEVPTNVNIDKDVNVIYQIANTHTKDVKNRLTIVSDLWKAMNNSQTKDEYKKASKEWDALFIEELDKKSLKDDIMAYCLKSSFFD